MNPPEEHRIPLGIRTTNGFPFTAITIDDSMMMRKLLIQILRGEGFEMVAEADSGRSGLEIYTSLEKKPDFVFLDVEMPEMNGIETMAELKKVNPQVKVIMVTSVTDERAVRALVELGIGGYVVKPFKREDLLLRVARILGRNNYRPT
ncbi:MAG: response regulator [Brevinematales bacterium]|nr:response regulator [Brevinematales bacterium]